MLKKFKNEAKEFNLLLRAVPVMPFSFLVLSLFAMNLLANKSINLELGWLALDCGVIISWITFLTMDIFTKHFGPKGATQLSMLATAINLFICVMFFIGSIIPGTWGESYVTGSEEILNNALNKTLGGTWYVILGSSIAFMLSATVNNFTNFWIGKAFRKNPESYIAYFCRSNISTAIGQFVDNFIFSFIVSRVFFGWTILQCITCSITGMLIEMLCEALFSGLGYRVCQKWRRQGVAKEYLSYRKGVKR